MAIIILQLNGHYHFAVKLGKYQAVKMANISLQLKLVNIKQLNGHYHFAVKMGKYQAVKMANISLQLK